MELAWLVVAGFVALVAAARGRARARAWREAAAAVGLADVGEDESLGFLRSITGTAHALRVRVEAYRRGKHNSGTRIGVGPLGHGPFGFAVRREGLGTAFSKAMGEREIEIGDPAFDDALYVQGHAPLARALLDAETRSQLLRLCRGEAWSGKASDVRAWVSGDLLQVEVRERLLEPAPDLAAALSTTIAVAQRLVAPADLPTRIGANLAGEPHPRVRLESVLTLIREHEGHPATRDALLAARADRSHEVRLRAAMALGEEGTACLVELASGEDVEDSCSARAVGALGQRIEREGAEEILQQALRGRRLATAIACLESLGRFGGSAAVLSLARVLEDGAGELRAAAARALGTAGAPGAEGPLLKVLGDGVLDVRIAAAGALGHAGTVAAIPHLREASERTPDRELGRAVRQAVARIQSRLPGAAPGQLSLADTEAAAGRLSLAEDGVAGRVSLVESEPRPD